MLNEVKYSRFADTKEMVSEIGLVDLIKLYINHRYVKVHIFVIACFAH